MERKKTWVSNKMSRTEYIQESGDKIVSRIFWELKGNSLGNGRSWKLFFQ